MLRTCNAPGKYYALLWEIVEGKFEEKSGVQVLRRVEKVTGNRSSFCQNPAPTSQHSTQPAPKPFEHEAIYLQTKPALSNPTFSERHAIDALSKRIYECSIDFFSQCFHDERTKKGNYRFSVVFFCPRKTLSILQLLMQRVYPQTNIAEHAPHCIGFYQEISNAELMK